MNIKNRRFILWCVLASIVLSSLLIIYGKTEYRYNRVNHTEVYSENGVFDLRGIDFSNTVVKLSGNVEHIEGEILTPTEFHKNADKIEIGSPTDTNEGRTVRLTLLMPEEKSYHIYTIGDYARKVFLNGEERGSVGVPSASAETFVPAFASIEGDVKAENYEIEMVVQGGNFVHVNTNGYTNIFVGETELTQWFVNYERSIEFSSIAILFFLALLHLLLAIMFGNHSLNLTFSASCLVWGVRLGFVGSKVLYEIFPNTPWEFAFKTEYITIPVGSILIIHLLYVQLKEALNKKVLLVFQVILTVFAIAFIFIDTYTMSGFLIPLQAVYILTLLYLVISGGVWLFKQKKQGTTIEITEKIAYVSLLIIAYAGVSDALYFNNISLFNITTPLAEIAILIFAIFEAIALFYITVLMMEQSKLAEKEALAKAQNLESLNKMKTEFLQNMSHEMKTPLTVISTGLSYATRQIQKPIINKNDTEETLNTVKNQTERLSRMVSGMVDMMSLSVGEHRRKIDFSKLLQNSIDAFHLIAEEKNIALKLEIENNLPFVFVDFDSFMRVMSNLISNSLDATQKGSITITATSDPRFITVIVTDTGCGIPSDLLEKITMRGISSKNSTGLGLYISQTIIHAHGGTLEIESTENIGTKITFTVSVYGGQEEGYRYEK